MGVDRPERALEADGPPSLDELRKPSRPSEALPQLRQAERDFATQGVDGVWPTLMEARVLSEISAVPGLQVTTLEVVCRSTVCRVELTEPTGPQPSFDPFAIAEALGLEPRLVLAAPNGHGTPMIVAFYGRRDESTTQAHQEERPSA